MSGPSSSTFDLPAYLQRIGLSFPEGDVPVNLDTLTKIQSAHIRAVPFENMDIVQKGLISIAPLDIIDKLVRRKRGGYCFETNLLLHAALQSLGFDVHCILSRVRYMKPPAVVTGFTHVFLLVRFALNPIEYLVDVGFGGLGPIVPFNLSIGDPQATPDGTYRVSFDAATAYHTLQSDHDGAWIDLYAFKKEKVFFADLELSNWWSCTHPTARWCNCLFAAIVVGTERHHILNDLYSIRSVDGTVTRRTLTDHTELLDLLVAVFRINLSNTNDSASVANIMSFLNASK